jgi:hypothetical protein
MRAAAAGRSTLGISKKVGRKYSKSDPGGKLPARKKRKPSSRKGKKRYG